MTTIDRLSLLEEAEACRRKALVYTGLPEAPFLLRVADAFEALNDQIAKGPGSRGALLTLPSR